MIDNIVIGQPVEGLELRDLGVMSNELTVTVDNTVAEKMGYFLPHLLVHVGLFKTTSEVRRINKDRVNSKKIIDPLSRNLWRTITAPEFTHFKVGKRSFWLIVGDMIKT